MKLSEELAKLFEAEIEKVIEKEINDPDYMPQKMFNTCKERSAGMIQVALVPIINTFALAIAKHRKESHREDTAAEMEALSLDLTDDQQEIGLMAWWRH